jgi:homoserine O-succinyltransferase
VKANVAILDMYQGIENHGMRNIRTLVEDFGKSNAIEISYDVFDIRGKTEVPEIHDYDIYICSGGPGSPIDSIGSEWEEKFFRLTDSIHAHNKGSASKKYLFLICHSFQLYCRHYDFGVVCERRSPAFGVFPVRKTEAGLQDELYKDLDDPFYIVDSREWQVIQPNFNKFFETGAEVLTLEKERPHIPLERALMAIRFSPEIFGTQFHPEADGLGMRHYLINDEKKKAQAIAQVGEIKYQEMLDHLDDEDKIMKTRSVVLPGFLKKALGLNGNTSS